jgi:hypothetical protein
MPSASAVSWCRASTIERETGKPYPLNPLAHPVDAGIVRIMTLAEHGYITVRP